MKFSCCWAKVRISLVARKVFCWEAKVYESLGESKEIRKIEILEVVSRCFVLWIGRSKSSKLDYCQKLLVVA